MADPVQAVEASATSDELVLRIHKGFSTRDQAGRFIRDFALTQGKDVVLQSSVSGGSNFTFRCDSETPCPFFVRIGQSKAAGAKCLRITSFNAEHENCTISAHPTCEQVIRDAAQPSIPAKVLMQQIKSSEAVSVSNRMAYRARGTVREEVEGNFLHGFATLESQLVAFSAKNGGAYTESEFDEEGRLVCAFLSHPYLKQHCENGQRVYGIDGTFSKHGMYPSVMLVLVGRDGNNKNIALGVGMYSGETSANAQWFLSCCEKAGVSFKDVPVFTDREKALLSAMSEHPEAIVRFCTRHIVTNVVHRFGKIVTDDIQDAIWALQGLESEEEFQSRLTAVSVSHPEVVAYLGEIDVKKWVLYPALGQIRLYGWRTTNFVESENGAAIPARRMHVFGVFNHYIDKFMSKAVSSDEATSVWLAGADPLTPHTKDLLEEQKREMGYHTVRKSSLTIAFVHDERIVRRVDVEKDTWSCSFMNQYGIRCRHLLSALENFGILS